MRTQHKNIQPYIIKVDLPENYVISEVLTQGRFANGQGQEYTQAYRIHYWRDGMQQFKEYRDNIGKTVNIYFHFLTLDKPGLTMSLYSV